MAKETGTHGDAQDSLRMSPEQMIEMAHMAADLMVSRTKNLSAEGAWDGEFRDALESKWRGEAPETGRPAKEVLQQAARDILPYAAQLDHPRSFGFIPSSPTWPGVVADFMAAGYNVNAATWLTASGPSHIELVVIDWFRRWLGYPESAGGLFTSGGSAASVDALVAAREAMSHPERATVYMSDQSHLALRRAAMIVGVRPECIRLIPCDRQFRLDVEALSRAVAHDRAAGLTPIAVCANAGAPSTGAIDPLEAIADYCESEEIWLHIDAAYGGFAVVTERGKQRLRGIERADSIGLDPHKWFFQPYEAGCLMVKDAGTLRSAFAIKPDILQDTVWGANHPNFADLGLQISRSFRALKVWMSVQTFGMAAFRRAISKGMDLATRAEEYVRTSPLLEILNPASLGIVCFRVNPTSTDVEEETLKQINRTVLARLFWEEPALVSSTVIRKKFSFRLCILNHTTTWHDVRETLQAIERFGSEAISAQAEIGTETTDHALE